MKRVLILALWLILLPGCASYRITSNIPAPAHAGQVHLYPVQLLAGDRVDKPYEVLGPIKVVVRKTSLFLRTPDQREADIALRQKACQIGADAVIDISYEPGFDLISWGHIAAEGTGVKFTQ